MAQIRYKKDGGTLAVQVSPHFKELAGTENGATQEGIDYLEKLTNCFRAQGIEGNILLYWIEEQECTMFGHDQARNPYQARTTPGYPATYFALLPTQ